MKKILSLFLLFFIVICSSCSKDEYTLTVIAPSGAPGIALANISHTYADEYSVELNKTSDVLKAAFAEGNADVIVAPVNLGASMYKASGAYQLASVITWGNLYFASQKSDFKLEDLNGADVVLFGEGTINDVIVKYVLKEKNITLGENSVYLASTQLTNQKLISDENAIVLVAEPALSTAQSKKGNITAISVQELYKEVSGSNSYPQAGCFVRMASAEEHQGVMDTFLERLEESCTLCTEKTSEIAGYAVELELGSDQSVLEKAIPNSNIQYVKASNAKADIEKVAALSPAMFGGAAPAEGFYYA